MSNVQRPDCSKVIPTFNIELPFKVWQKDVGPWTLDVGHWTWTMDIGRWTLDKPNTFLELNRLAHV